MRQPASKRLLSFIITIVLALVAVPVVSGQSGDDLQVYISKQFGYAAGSQVQGSFRLEARGPADLTEVTFFIDGQPIGTVSQAPFRIVFSTGDYSTGWHEISATGKTASGLTITTAPGSRRAEFVTSQQAWASTQKIMLPMFILLGVLMAVGIAVPFLQIRSNKRNPVPLGARRQYGFLGGAICPKCRRPFSIHWWGLNAVTGKFDRCDYCGRWSLVRAATREALAQAEADELRQAQPETPIAALNPEAKLRKELDESRFTD
jgi:hypothetical protein